MQPPTVREVITMLERDGFVYHHASGSHRFFCKNGRTVVLSGKKSAHIPKGTWAAIKRQAGW